MLTKGRTTFCCPALSNGNLSDKQTEFQIRDQLSFTRLLGLTLGGRVPESEPVVAG